MCTQFSPVFRTNTLEQMLLLSENEFEQLERKRPAAAMPVSVFEHFRDAERPVALWVVASTLASIAAVGVILNASILVVTVRAKMRGTCHFLLALTSLFEVCHQSSHFVYLFAVTVGPRFVRYHRCVQIQMLPTFGLNAVQVCLPAIAADRLLSTLFPIFYKTTNASARRKAAYLAAILSPIIGYGVVSAAYFHVRSAAYTHDDVFVVCQIADVFYEEMYTYFMLNTFALDVLTALLYIAVWVAIPRKVKAADTQNKLLKSLLIIVFVDVGGYFVNLGLMYLGLTYLPWPWSWYQFEFNGCLLNIAAASNAPILYSTSSEYRVAYKKLLQVVGLMNGAKNDQPLSASVEMRRGVRQRAISLNISRERTTSAAPLIAQRNYAFSL